MIVGGLAGRPVQSRLTYVLPIRRTDWRSGKALTISWMPVHRFRPSGAAVVGQPVNQGATDGGESSLPEIDSSDPLETLQQRYGF